MSAFNKGTQNDSISLNSDSPNPPKVHSRLQKPLHEASTNLTPSKMCMAISNPIHQHSLKNTAPNFKCIREIHLVTFTHILQREICGLIDVASTFHQGSHTANQHSGPGVCQFSAMVFAVILPFVRDSFYLQNKTIFNLL